MYGSSSAHACIPSCRVLRLVLLKICKVTKLLISFNKLKIVARKAVELSDNKWKVQEDSAFLYYDSLSSKNK
jgi:hypothetical protein